MLGRFQHNGMSWQQSIRVALGVIFLGTALLGTAHAADTTPPSTPNGLTATIASPLQINLSWNASTDDVGVAGYRIDRCTGPGCTNFSQIATSTTTSYSDTGLTSRTMYRYRIRAFDAASNLSLYSHILSRATRVDTTSPSVPAALTVTATSSTQLKLSWTASTDNVGVTGYRIERCTGSSCTSFTQIATSTTTSFSNTGLTESTTYRYRIRANDAAGNLSGYSSIVNGTTPSAADTTPPTAPGNLTATASSGSQISLTWTASTDNVGVTGYSVERCVGVGCASFAQVATPTTASYSDTGLTDATTYRYRVRARDAANNSSAYSVTATATTSDTTPPSAPANLTAAAISSTQINLSWMAATDNVGVSNYLIERCVGIACSNFVEVGTSATATYTDSSVTAASNYTYRIRATDAGNNLSGYSNVANTSTQYGGPITLTYSYDKLGRIMQATGSDGSFITYTYDSNGNITRIDRQ